MSVKKQKSLSKGERDQQFKLAQLHARTRLFGTVLNTFIMWTGLVVIAYFGYLSIDTLAGRKTLAEIGISVFGDINLNDVLMLIFGTGGISYGWSQRKLRKKTIARFEHRNKDYEKLLDCKRSSSGLTTLGDTHPLDEI